MDRCHFKKNIIDEFMKNIISWCATGAHTVLLSVLLTASTGDMMAQARRNVSLDESQPIELTDNAVIYRGESLKLGPKSLLLDGALSDAEAARSPYVFNSLQGAVAALTDGSEEEPMTLYIAPYVYWVDDPDDPAIRVGKDGREPFGMTIRCQNLHLIGLDSDAENVVLASNRGQTQGAVGNFTMLDFWGDGLTVRNLTMGNFCNVDLDYKLNPALSRKKRMAAITQAHVAYCHGDRVVADNVRFISRLNMNPLNGARRILFNNCHMESTDDALTGTGVFLNCTADFYGTKPFWRSDMGGAVFLNSDLYVRHSNAEQYFCKAVGPLSIIDCRFHSEHPVYIGWTSTPTDWLRCYQSGVTLNGEPYLIGNRKAENTVRLEEREALKAFRLMDGDSVVYNVYNLLKGDDGWDPLGQRELVERLSRENGVDYTAMASCLSVEPLEASMQTGDGGMTLRAALKRHSNYPLNNRTVSWCVADGGEEFVRLSATEGLECRVEAINHSDTTRTVTVIAYTDDGMECGTALTVAPDYVDAPQFTTRPKLKLAAGEATLDYALDLGGRSDESLITWYRCTDSKGGNAIPVAVSRLNTPHYTYCLTRADVGYYLMATIQPKHLRCHAGEMQTLVTKRAIRAKDVEQSGVKGESGSVVVDTDFFDFPTENQHRIIPGFWTVEGYKPTDTAEFDWSVDPDQEYWSYERGINGASSAIGLLQVGKGARMLYTPVDGVYGDAEVTWHLDPAKTAGQGFGSATGQYLDLYIKFDTQTLTGYALRIVRTVKSSHAVDFMLVRYDKGVVTPISEAVTSSCYRTGCTIKLSCHGNRLTAHAETTTPVSPAAEAGVVPVVTLSAEIEQNAFGGFGCQHTGSWGESATMVRALRAQVSRVKSQE
jgi:hypothetical protein